MNTFNNTLENKITESDEPPVSEEVNDSLLLVEGKQKGDNIWEIAEELRSTYGITKQAIDTVPNILIRLREKCNGTLVYGLVDISYSNELSTDRTDTREIHGNNLFVSIKNPSPRNQKSYTW